MNKVQAQNILGVLERVANMHGVINTPVEAIAFADAVVALRTIAAGDDGEEEAAE